MWLLYPIDNELFFLSERNPVLYVTIKITEVFHFWPRAFCSCDKRDLISVGF